MAKFYGNSVKKGRIGGSVFRIRHGETIESQYQPVVNNPRTPAQTSARASFKLIVQLAEIMAPVIPLSRLGNVSPRNRFVALNRDAVTFNELEASVAMSAIKLTKSVVGLPTITATRSASGITAGFQQSAASGDVNISRVVYVMLVKLPDGKLRYVGSRVATAPGDTNQWQVSFPLQPYEEYVYAYGVRDNTDAAREIFGDLTMATAEAIAKLIVTRTLLETDVTVTETKYTLVSES